MVWCDDGAIRKEMWFVADDYSQVSETFTKAMQNAKTKVGKHFCQPFCSLVFCCLTSLHCDEWWLGKIQKLEVVVTDSLYSIF